MPELTPNYLSIDALGKVIANFTGGVTVPESIGLATPDQVHAFNFKDAANALVTRFFSRYDQAGNQRSWQILSQLGTTLTQIAGSLAPNLNIASISIRAQSATADTGILNLLTSDGASKFIQGLDSADKWTIVGFFANNVAVPAGYTTVNVPRYVPAGAAPAVLGLKGLWPFYSIAPSAGASIIGDELNGAPATRDGTGNLTTINVDLQSTIAQTVSVYAIALCLDFP